MLRRNAGKGYSEGMLEGILGRNVEKGCFEGMLRKELLRRDTEKGY